jgi:hypothetical protein
MCVVDLKMAPFCLDFALRSDIELERIDFPYEPEISQQLD